MNSLPTRRATSLILREACLRSSARTSVNVLGSSSLDTYIPPIENVLNLGGLRALRRSMKRISDNVLNNNFNDTSNGIVIGVVFGVAVIGTVSWHLLPEDSKQNIRDGIQKLINLVMHKIDRVIEFFHDKIKRPVFDFIKSTINSFIEKVDNLFKNSDKAPNTFPAINQATDNIHQNLPVGSVQNDAPTTEFLNTTDNVTTTSNALTNIQNQNIEDASVPHEIPLEIEFVANSNDFNLASVYRYVFFAIHRNENVENVEPDPLVESIFDVSIAFVKSYFIIRNIIPTQQQLKTRLISTIDVQIQLLTIDRNY